jgi:hypothetical protein
MIALGRLVVDAKHPSQDFWPQTATTLRSSDINVSPFDHFQEFLEKSEHLGIRAKVTQLFHGNAASQTSSKEVLVAPQAKRYSLSQPTSHFHRMCEDKATREWIEKTLKHRPIFLVVGLITVTQAAVRKINHGDMQFSSSVSIPVTEAITNGIPTMVGGPGNGGPLDLGADVSGGHLVAASSSFVATGERAIGVQYMKVKFRLFSSNKVETSFLERNPNRWIMLFGGDRVGSGDILEAGLEDIVAPDDLELEEDVFFIEDKYSQIVFVD